MHGRDAGSLCRMQLLKATPGEPVEVSIRRARADFVQVCPLVERACCDIFQIARARSAHQCFFHVLARFVTWCKETGAGDGV